MDLHDLDTEEHRHTVHDRSSRHGPDGSCLVGFFPEHTEDKYPEKGCFQTAKSKHVNLPDHIWRIDGDKEYDQSEHKGAKLAEHAGLSLGYLLLTFFLLVHVNVLYNRRSRRQKQGR